MTQLNLSGTQSNNTQQKPKHEDESITNQTVGALGALAMFAAVIVVGSCTGSSKPVAMQPPVQPTTPVSAPVLTAPAPAPTPVAVAKPQPKKRRAATLTYVSRDYGLSFNFPRGYALKTGKDAQAASAAMEPAMNFAQPGGVALAAVELPANSYPGTDFKSAWVNVSVNTGMTPESCAQFAVPRTDTTTGDSSPLKIGQSKIGALEFHEVVNSSAALLKPADSKYYHAFGNGACYEFALGVVTDGNGKVEELAPVDRSAVFEKLEKVLATVKLQPIVSPENPTPETQNPETQAPVPAVATSTPADSANAPGGDATAPNF